MSGPSGDDWISVPEAAGLLGLRLKTVRTMVDRGDLPAEVVLPSPRPKLRRRTIRIRRQDVVGLIERCKVKPGQLRHLYRPAGGAAPVVPAG